MGSVERPGSIDVLDVEVSESGLGAFLPRGVAVRGSVGVEAKDLDFAGGGWHVRPLSEVWRVGKEWAAFLGALSEVKERAGV